MGLSSLSGALSHLEYIQVRAVIMGANASKRKNGLKAKDVQELAEKTKFSEDKIKHWHEGFLKDCPTGKLTKTEFSRSTPNSSPTVIRRHLPALSSTSSTIMAMAQLHLKSSCSPCPSLRVVIWRIN